MDKHNRHDYKGPGARENTHAGSLRILFQSPGYDRTFSAALPIFYLRRRVKEKGRRYLRLLSLRIPDLTKILTVWEIFKYILPRYTEQVRPVFFAKKQQLRAGTITWSNLSRWVYARYNLAKFRPPPRKETVAREKFRRRRGFLGSWIFFPTNVRTVLCKAKYRLHLK